MQGDASFSQSSISKTTNKLNLGSIGYTNHLHITFILSFCLDNQIIPAFQPFTI